MLAQVVLMSKVVCSAQTQTLSAAGARGECRLVVKQICDTLLRLQATGARRARSHFMEQQVRIGQQAQGLEAAER